MGRIFGPTALISSFTLSLLAATTSALADFERESPACPGAIELIEGEPDDPGGLIEVRIPSGGTASCNAFPTGPNGDIETQIVGDGSGITFINNVAGISGSTPIFEAVLTGPNHKITNNGDLFVLVEGVGAEVVNAAGFMDGLILGDDSSLANASGGTVLGMTIEGDRVIVTNDGGVLDTDPVFGAQGVLVIGEEADIQNNGDGVIAVRGTESIAAGVAGDHSRIANQGVVSAEGTEAIAAGIDGDGTEDKKVEIVNDGTLQATGTEALAAIIGGDHALITNNAMVTATGTEARGLTIDGNHGEIVNNGELTAEGDFAAGMVIEGNDGTLTNNVMIDATGDVAVGMGAVGTGNDLLNNGGIEADGENAFGIAAFGQDATIENRGNGDITTNGAGAHGIILGHEDAQELANMAEDPTIPAGVAQKAQGTVANDGDILTFGVAEAPTQGEAEPAGADGIHVFADNTEITNTGDITTLGRNSSAIAGIGNDLTVNQASTIETRNASSDAIDIEGNSATVNNTGQITTLADESAGVFVAGTGASITNGEDGMVDDAVTINTSGEKSHGMALGRQSQEGEAPRSGGNVKNFGKIGTSGVEADGIHSFANDGVIENRNEIATTGDRAAAINQFGDRVDITNLDAVSTEGETAPGIRARGQTLTIVNGAPEGEVGENAKIATVGDGAHGVLVAPESGSETDPDFIVPSNADVTNHTAIETGGDGAHGVLAFVDDSKIENKGDIKVTGKDSIAVSVRGGKNEILNEGALEAGTLEQAQIEAAQPPDPDGSPDGRVGVNFVDETVIQNSADGSIAAFGENAAGVRGRDGDKSAVANDGAIIAFGKGARGVDIEGDDVRVQNVEFDQQADRLVEAFIAVEGENAVGVRTLGQGAFVSNRVTKTEDGVETVGIEVVGDNSAGVDVTATGSGSFLVENAGKMLVRGQGGSAVGMALRNDTGSALAFSSQNAGSDCLGSPKGAGLLNCGSLTVNGDDSVGLLAQGVNESTIDNFGTIDVTGDRAVAIKLDDGANGAGADNNVILNLTDATADGFEAKGVSIKGDGNVLVQGNSEIILPVDETTFTVISQLIDVMTSAASGGMETGEQTFPLGDIRASGTNAVGVSVEGDNNVVGVSMGLSDFDPTGENPNLPTAPKIASVIAAEAGSKGVELSGDNNTVANFGIISGEAKAIQGGAGKETVIGAGIFVGDIDLAGGDDDFNLGVGMDERVFVGNDTTSIAGMIDGGAGIDTFRLIDSKFFGGGGDLVSSGVEDFPEEFFRFGTVDGDRVLNFEKFIVDITDQNVDLKNQFVVDTTTIENGTLRLDSARLEAERIDIRAGGFLTGNGTITALPNDIGLVNLSEIVVETGAGVMPGDSPGELEFIGDTFFAGLLEIEIAGREDGLFDRLLIDGDLTFDEALVRFVFLDGFLPEEGDVFDFLSVTGDLFGFDTLSFDFLGLPNGFAFDVAMRPLAGGFGIGLATTGAGPSDIPEPATLALFGIGIAGLAGLGRRRKGFRLP